MNGTKLEEMQGKDKTAFVNIEETKAKFIRNRLYLFDQCADQCLIEIINTSNSKRVKSSVSKPTGEYTHTNTQTIHVGILVQNSEELSVTARWRSSAHSRKFPQRDRRSLSRWLTVNTKLVELVNHQIIQ